MTNHENGRQSDVPEIDLTSRNADIVLAAELAVLSAFNGTRQSFGGGEGYISPAGNRVMDLTTSVGEGGTHLEIRSLVAQAAHGFGQLRILEQTFETFGIDGDGPPGVVLTKRFMLADEYAGYVAGDGANYVDIDRWLSEVSYDQADAFLRANLPSSDVWVKPIMWKDRVAPFTASPTFDWDLIRNEYLVNSDIPELPFEREKPQDGVIPVVVEPERLLEAVAGFYTDLHEGLSSYGLYGH